MVFFFVILRFACGCAGLTCGVVVVAAGVCYLLLFGVFGGLEVGWEEGGRSKMVVGGWRVESGMVLVGMIMNG